MDSLIIIVTNIIEDYDIASRAGPIPCMLTSETFRQGPRGAAVGIVQAIHWAMNMVLMFSFRFMEVIVYL